MIVETKIKIHIVKVLFYTHVTPQVWDGKMRRTYTLFSAMKGGNKTEREGSRVGKRDKNEIVSATNEWGNTLEFVLLREEFQYSADSADSDGQGDVQSDQGMAQMNATKV